MLRQAVWLEIVRLAVAAVPHPKRRLNSQIKASSHTAQQQEGLVPEPVHAPGFDGEEGAETGCIDMK
jgi:hypothetical protein